MALLTGNQLKAARALAGMHQGELAQRSGVNVNIVSAMEKHGGDSLTGGLDKIKAVMAVLEAAGIEFLNHGHPGVRVGRSTLVVSDQPAPQRPYQPDDLVRFRIASVPKALRDWPRTIGTVIKTPDSQIAVRTAMTYVRFPGLEPMFVAPGQLEFADP